MKIEVATVQDWDEIRAIYRAGILLGDATFNTVEHIPESGEAWFEGKLMTFKAVADGRMVGWSTLSATSKRPVYRGVAEISIYVSPTAHSCGIGSSLMAYTLSRAKDAGIWTIEARIFPSNIASIRLHQKFDFRILGIHDKRAQQFGVWRDVAYLEWRARQRDLHTHVANSDDLPLIRTLLTEADLPTDDIKSSAITFLTMKEQGNIVASVGLEQFIDQQHYMKDALIRSLVVDEPFRGRNLGAQLVETAERFARGRNIERLWLLTTTAAPFFEKLGYEVVKRSAAPYMMQESPQFSALCPDSAVCMRKQLS